MGFFDHLIFRLGIGDFFGIDIPPLSDVFLGALLVGWLTLVSLGFLRY